MSRFDIDTGGLRTAAGRLDGISENLEKLSTQIRNVRNTLNRHMGDYDGVISALEICETNSTRCRDKVSTIGQCGLLIAEKYKNTESAITGNMQLDKFGNIVNSNPNNNIGTIAKNVIDFLTHNPIVSLLPLPVPISALAFMIDVIYDDETGKAETSEKFSHTIYETEGKKYKYDPTNKKFVEEESSDDNERSSLRKEYTYAKKEYDSEQHKWVDSEDSDNSDENKLEADIKLHTWEAEDMPEWEFAKAEASIERDSFRLKANADVLKAETHAESYIGPLSAGAAVGASFTAFTATAQAEFGDDMYGSYLSGTVTAGKASAEASVSAGVYDKNGNFNPNAKVELSAEAIAGEISGTAGQKILGTDVSVTGTLNYGVGAHANIGYDNGKFQLDVGATLGVGGSVEFEIDTSKTINAVCDFAHSALSTIF